MVMMMVIWGGLMGEGEDNRGRKVEINVGYTVRV